MTGAGHFERGRWVNDAPTCDPWRARHGYEPTVTEFLAEEYVDPRGPNPGRTPGHAWFRYVGGRWVHAPDLDASRGTAPPPEPAP